MMEKTK